jgi:hypothetical protein
MRCRNCGETHPTQNCGEFGPWYPEEGKTAADYADLAEKINNMVAADVIAEHEASHGQPSG